MSVIGKLSGQFFIFKQDTARRTWYTSQVNLFACNFIRFSLFTTKLSDKYTV